MDIFWLDQLLQPPCDSVSRLDVQVQQIEGLHSHTGLGSGSLHCALHSTTQLATCRYQQFRSCDFCGAWILYAFMHFEARQSKDSVVLIEACNNDDVLIGLMTFQSESGVASLQFCCGRQIRCKVCNAMGPKGS